MLYVWPVVDLPPDAFDAVARRLAPLTEGLGLEQVVVSGSLASGGSDPVEAVVRIGYEPGHGVTMRLTEPPTEAMQPLDDYTRKLVQMRRRGLTYPYELIPRCVARTGRSSSTISTRPVRSCRSTVRPAGTPPGSWWCGVHPDRSASRRCRARGHTR